MKEFILVAAGFVLGDAIGVAGMTDICNKVIGLFG